MQGLEGNRAESIAGSVFNLTVVGPLLGFLTRSLAAEVTHFLSIFSRGSRTRRADAALHSSDKASNRKPSYKRHPKTTGFTEGSFTDLGPYIILQDHCRPQRSSV